MRTVLLLPVVVIVVAAGCNPEGDNIYNTYNNYYPEDSTSNPDTTEPYTVQITSPVRNEVIVVWHNWIENPYPYYNSCNWGYQADTVYVAEITTDIPESIIEARVFLRTSTNSSYYEYSLVRNPGQDQFLVEIFDYYTQFSYNASFDLDCAFWVSLTAADSSNYISPTIPFRIVSRINYDMATVPLIPLADTLFENSYDQRLSISWCPRSPNVDSFHVAIRRDVTGVITRLRYSGEGNYGENITDYLPLNAYSVWITASNDYGESAASDTMHVTTREPNPPDNFSATIYSDESVRLSWSNRANPDTLQIARRDTLSDWATIRTLECDNGYCPSYFIDSTATSNTVYYYRLGMQFENGLWWAPDSVGVWIP